jgi:PKD repeat protein
MNRRWLAVALLLVLVCVPMVSAAINYQYQSEQIVDGLNYTFTGLTNGIYFNTTVAPTGQTTGESINETTDTSSHFLYALSGGLTYTAGLNYTSRYYLQPNPTNYIQLSYPSAAFGSAQYATFNINTCTVVNSFNGVAVTQTVNSSWCEVAFTSKATSTATAVMGFLVFTNNNPGLGRVPSYTGNISQKVNVWGGMVEQNDAPTQYNATNVNPHASFSSNTTGGIASSQAVAFTDWGGPLMDTWNWSWGDATANSTSENPVHIFPATGGVYIVNLAETYRGVQYQTQTPIAVLGYNWSFGDGSVSSLQNPSHAYSSSGTYTVIENVTGGSPIIANFTASTSQAPGALPKTIQFNDVSISGLGTTVYNATSLSIVIGSVDFTANVTSGAVPLAVQFTDLSGV